MGPNVSVWEHVSYYDYTGSGTILHALTLAGELDDPSVPSKGDSRIAPTVRSVFVGRPGGALGPTAPPGWGRAPALLASVWTKSQVSRLMGVSQWPRKRGNATVTQTVKIVARAQVANKAHSTPT